MIPMHEEAIPDQIALAIFTSHALEFLKSSRFFPWLSHMSGRANRVVGMLVAWASGAGIELGLNDYSLTEGGRIVIAIPMLSVVVASIMHATFQWGTQEVYYQKVVKPEADRTGISGKFKAVMDYTPPPAPKPPPALTP